MIVCVVTYTLVRIYTTYTTFMTPYKDVMDTNEMMCSNVNN